MTNLKKIESQHYIFNYKENSLAHKDIDEIIDLQEKCFDEITKTLKVNYPNKISYYLCDSPEEVGIIYGDNEPCNGFADSKNNAIYAVYNEKIKCIGAHEDAHIISYYYNRPNSCAIREGLAMFFDKSWWGINNFVCTKIYFELNKYCKISDLIIDEKFYKLSCEVTYPIMGAFTDFLINEFGIDNYINFYKDNEFRWLKYFGFSLSAIEDRFVEKIKKLDISENDRNIAISILVKTN